MNTDYVEEMIWEVRHALDHMSLSAQTHLPQMGEEFRMSLSNLDERLEEIRNRRKRDILMGQGPMAQLRTELGYAKPKAQVNIFEQWSAEDRLDLPKLNCLMAEFFGASMVMGNEGGDYYPTAEGLEEISVNPGDLSTGLYRITDGWIGMVLTVLDGSMVHHLIYPLKTSVRTRQRLDPKVVSYAEAEKMWVAHKFYEVLNLARVRSTLVGWLDSQGVAIPTPITEDEVKRGVLERIALEEEAGVEVLKSDIGKRKIEATVDNYRVTAIYTTLGEEKEPHVVLMVKTFHGVNMWQSDKSVDWKDLSPTKQQQLYRKLTSVEKPNVDT